MEEREHLGRREERGEELTGEHFVSWAISFTVARMICKKRLAIRSPELQTLQPINPQIMPGSISHLSRWSEEEEVSVVTAAVCLGRAAIVSYLTHHTATVHVTVLCTKEKKEIITEQLPQTPQTQGITTYSLCSI